MKRLTLVVLAIGIAGASIVKAATTYTSYADEFVTGQVHCGEGAACYALSEFDGDWWDSHIGEDMQEETWDFLGHQSLSAKANVKSKVWSRIVTVNPVGYCYTTTHTINRYRGTPPPAIGSTCSGGTYQGQSSTTFTSCGDGDSARHYWNRLLPVFDFSGETLTGEVAYREEVTLTFTNGDVYHYPGCFKILWST